MYYVHACIMIYVVTVYVGMGTIFRLGEQKFNNFSVGDVGNQKLVKKSRQSNSKYNFM